MQNDYNRELLTRSCLRFGKMALDMGFVTTQQLKEAMVEQIDDDISNKRHRLLGEIFLVKGWMTLKQIDEVLIELSKEERMSKVAS